MPATTYYVTTTNPRVTVPISAYAMKRTFWRAPKVYRDLFQPLVQGTIANAGGTGALNEVAGVPVVAVEGTTYQSGGAVSTMTVKAASPDHFTHTPHRTDWTARSGYAFLLADGGSIPDPVLPNASQACTFNAASATDLLTQATGSWWPDTGDIVTVGTAGNGLSTSALYTFVKVSSTTGKLMLNGAIVDISGTITGVTLSLVTEIALPDPVADVLYIEDPVLISTGEPL